MEINKPLHHQYFSAQDSTAKKAAKYWLLDIVGLIVFLAVFYAVWLNSYPLFTPDEARYSEVAREMLATHDYITPRVNGIIFLDKPIFYYWLQAIAIHFFGLKEWSLRFFPILISIGGCVFTYICGRHLFGRCSALLSAIILATAPLYFGLAHYADLNLEVGVFISCTLLAFITAIYTPAWRRTFLFCLYFFAGLACLTKGLIGIVFPIMIIGSWIISLWQWRVLARIHLIKGLLLTLFISVPWYYLVQKANPSFFQYFFITQHVSRFLSVGKFNNEVAIWFYLPVVVAGFYPWITLFFAAISSNTVKWLRSLKQHAIEWYLILWVILIFIFFSIPHAKTVGYILPIFPAMALLVGHYLAQHWDSPSNQIRLLISFSFVTLALGVTILLLWLPYLSWIEMNTALHHHLIFIAGITFLSALITLVFYRMTSWRVLFFTYTISNILILLTAVHGAKYYNTNSIKPLAEMLQPLLTKDDEVVAYFRFNYDAPIYLQRNVTVVANWNPTLIQQRDNWQREWLLGMQMEDTTTQLIDEKTFLKQWRSGKRMYVFVSANYLDQFHRLVRHYFLIGQTSKIILVSNQFTMLNLNERMSYVPITT